MLKHGNEGKRLAFLGAEAKIGALGIDDSQPAFRALGQPAHLAWVPQSARWP